MEKERMSPSTPGEGQTRGYIIPVGGAESKLRDPVILERFVTLCGADEARIGIIPTASQDPETGDRYGELFLELGAAEAPVFDFQERKDCWREDWLEGTRKMTGIFMTGGNQLRLSTTIGGTPAARLLRRLNASGVHIAGTSAGAAFLSEHMIAFGDEGPTPRGDMVTLAPGLGLTNRVIVDQHFRVRGRLGRLITALAYNPFAVGIGLDENTAAFIAPDDTVSVTGSGGITIVDPSEVEYSSMDSARRHDPVSVIGLRLHVLAEDGTFDLETRQAGYVPRAILTAAD
jgi:cyanophycinase